MKTGRSEVFLYWIYYFVTSPVQVFMLGLES